MIIIAFTIFEEQSFFVRVKDAKIIELRFWDDKKNNLIVKR